MYTPQIAQIIEKDLGSQRNFNRILDDLGFLQIETSLAIGDSVDLYFELKPDLVLVEVAEPAFEGIEIIKKLSQSDCAHSHFIAVSELSDRKTVMACIEGGASHYILKNCDPNEMERRLVSFIQKARFDPPVMRATDGFVRNQHRTFL